MCKKLRLIPLSILLLALASCARPTPIPVYVTPTPAGPTPVPTAIPEIAQPTPTATETVAGVTPPTETPTEALTPAATPTPFEGTFGPVVPPAFTPPPTETPRPTRTPMPGTPTITLTPSISPTPSITPTPLPGLDPLRIGIQIHPRIEQSLWERMLQRAEQLNVGWVKVQFQWDEMEPDGPGSQSDYWRQMELYMQTALRYGFQVLVSVTKAPDWARPTNEENGPPSDPQELARFITSFLDRFGPAIHAIEVWNEPNLLREWRGAPMNGATYMRYFDAAYRAINTWNQQNDQGHRIRVVTAGLAPTGNSQWSVDDRLFLRQMYQSGLARYTDVGVGAHPYAWGNAPDARCCNPVPNRNWDDDPHFFFLDTIEAYRQIMVNSGHASAQLWITEFGWATYDGFGVPAPQPFFDYVDEMSQAHYTIKALDIIQNSGNYNYVGPMILWNLNFATLPEAVAVHREEQAGYSLLRPDQTERPLYWILWDALNN